MVIGAGSSARLPHNLTVAFPEGFYGLIVPRSSTLANKGLIVISGTIDPDFHGELQTVVFNATNHSVQVLERERLSQLLVLPLNILRVVETDLASMPKGESRGALGWGSSGGFAPSRSK